MEPLLELDGAMYAYDPKEVTSDDCFRTGGDLWRVMTEGKRQLLIDNTARNMTPVTENIKYRIQFIATGQIRIMGNGWLKR